MSTFHNNPQLKTEYCHLARKANSLAELLPDNNIILGPSVLGLPQWLLRMEGIISGYLPEPKTFACKLLEAIPVGENLQPLVYKVAILFLMDLQRILIFDDDEITKSLLGTIVEDIEQVARLSSKDKEYNPEQEWAECLLWSAFPLNLPIMQKIDWGRISNDLLELLSKIPTTGDNHERIPI